MNNDLLHFIGTGDSTNTIDWKAPIKIASSVDSFGCPPHSDKYIYIVYQASDRKIHLKEYTPQGKWILQDIQKNTAQVIPKTK